MVCPVCRCEAIIKKFAYSDEDGKQYITNTFTCRNRRCKQFDKEIGEEKKEVQPTNP